MKPYEDMRTMTDLAQGHHNRYQTLNLQNLLTHKRPTVEFRVFAGTLNIVKIKAYIQLCLALVAKAQSSTPKVKWDREVKVSRTGRSNDTGSSAMNVLLMSLGWRKFHGRALETQKTFGMLTAAEMPRMVKALKQMARKYDGPRLSQIREAVNSSWRQHGSPAPSATTGANWEMERLASLRRFTYSSRRG